MTTVVFRKARNGEYRELFCSGHAGYGEYGKDIVCAALSVLIINTLNALEELCSIRLKPESDEKSGTIRCVFPEKMGEKAALLLDSLALGCTGVQKQYGKKYCNVKFEEV